MPRGSRATKKAVPKRTRKVTVKQEPLPDFEKFLVDLYGWPDVTDMLAADPFKEALEQFSDVAAFRDRFKESLAPCYVKRRVSFDGLI